MQRLHSQQMSQDDKIAIKNHVIDILCEKEVTFVEATRRRIEQNKNIDYLSIIEDTIDNFIKGKLSNISELSTKNKRTRVHLRDFSIERIIHRDNQRLLCNLYIIFDINTAQVVTVKWLPVTEIESFDAELFSERDEFDKIFG